MSEKIQSHDAGPSSAPPAVRAIGKAGENAVPPVKPSDREVFYIGPAKTLNTSYFRELCAARQLLFVLIARDLRVRYKQTLLGAGWVVLQPLLTVVAYSVIFGFIAKVPSDGVPYPIFLLTALLPWIFFQRLVVDGAGCISSNVNLVGKIYFPRLILPLATLGSLSVDLLVGFLVALVAMILFGYHPGWQVVFLPLVILLTACVGLALALLLAPIEVKYRDVRMIVPIMLQVLMFASPIFYSLTAVPEKYRWVFEINPIAVIATGTRWAFLNQGNAPPLYTTVMSVCLVLPVLCVGMWLFVRAEALFADKI